MVRMISLERCLAKWNVVKLLARAVNLIMTFFFFFLLISYYVFMTIDSALIYPFILYIIAKKVLFYILVR